jgi:hypothetical protein
MVPAVYCIYGVYIYIPLQVALVSRRDVVAARIVKGRLERTTLGQVARDISLQFKPGACVQPVGN